MKEKTKQGGLSAGQMTPEVMEMDAINFRGNIIPPVWIRQLRNPGGKPNVAAIFILADVVYWYRPLEIRDEQTGRVVGKRRRFEGDFLRRSYADIELQFGFTKRIASLALDILEQMDLVHRLVRPFQQGNMVQPNTMFLRPVPKRIADLNDGAWLPGRIYGSDAHVSTVVTPTSPRWLRGRSDITKTTTKTTTDTLSLQREKNISVEDVQEFDEMEAAAGHPPSSARPTTESPWRAFQKAVNETGIEPIDEDHRRGHFPLEMDYLERVQLNAKITEAEAAKVMCYFLTETEDGQAVYATYLDAVGAEKGELTNVKLLCASVAAKSRQYMLRDWRRHMLSRLLSFMKIELASDRRQAAREQGRGAAAGAKKSPLKAVTDNPSGFDYSQNTGFDGN